MPLSSTEKTKSDSRLLRGDVDLGRFRAAVLDRISHQILQQLNQPDLVRMHDRQRIPGDLARFCSMEA